MKTYPPSRGNLLLLPKAFTEFFVNHSFMCSGGRSTFSGFTKAAISMLYFLGIKSLLTGQFLNSVMFSFAWPSHKPRNSNISHLKLSHVMEFLLLRYSFSNTDKAVVFLHIAQAVLTDVVLSGWRIYLLDFIFFLNYCLCETSNAYL